MPYWVYILKSDSTDRLYCGQTKDLERRIKEHNDPDYRSTRTTKNFPGPWEIIWSCDCADRSQAMKLEQRIKNRGISRFMTDLQKQ
jgi:putative endonuclease